MRTCLLFLVYFLLLCSIHIDHVHVNYKALKELGTRNVRKFKFGFKQAQMFFTKFEKELVI
jgi:hypothetical protein